MQFEGLRNVFFNRPTGIKLGSAFAITGLITYFECRPFTILVSSIYLIWIYRTFFTNYKIHISKELIKKIKMFDDNLRTLRQTRPNVFFGFVGSFLFLLAIFGHFVSDACIMLLCLISAALLTSIYEVRIIKEKDSKRSSMHGEFEPQLDDISMDILNRIGDDADDTAVYSKDDGTSDNDSDDSDLESLLPTTSNLLDAETVDNDGNEINPLLTQSAEYKRKHFNATSSDSSDSSSSTDDDSITRGLDFQTDGSYITIEPKKEKPVINNLLGDFQNVVANSIIDSINQFHTSNVNPFPPNESSDSDSDFEILDDKDLVHYKP